MTQNYKYVIFAPGKYNNPHKSHISAEFTMAFLGAVVLTTSHKSTYELKRKLGIGLANILASFKFYDITNEMRGVVMRQCR